MTIPNLQMLQMKMTTTEDDLKKLKGEYLSNNWLYLVQIINLSWGDQINLYKYLKPQNLQCGILKIIFCHQLYECFKWIQIEDDVKILKWEYHSNKLLDLSQIQSLLWGANIKHYKTSNWDELTWFKFIYTSNQSKIRPRYLNILPYNKD